MQPLHNNTVHVALLKTARSMRCSDSKNYFNSVFDYCMGGPLPSSGKSSTPVFLTPFSSS